MGFDSVIERVINMAIEMAVEIGGEPDGLGQTADFPRRR